MHRIAATPGGWNPQSEGVIFLQQTPAPIVFITAADTDIQTLATAISKLPAGFPSLRVANLLQLQQQLTIDTYAEEVLEKAEVIIIRLLGGRSYWSYGLEVVREVVQKTKAELIVMPGDNGPDPDLISHSTVSLSAVDRLWRYFTEGGVQNFVNGLKWIADIGLKTAYNPPLPKEVPRVGIYHWLAPHLRDSFSVGGADDLSSLANAAKVGILFYRAHYLSGNLAPIDALCQALAERNLAPVPVFVSSLREPDVQAELAQYFQPQDSEQIQLLLNTTSFAVSGFRSQDRELENIKSLDVPVLQVIFSGGTAEQWKADFQGLSPRDVAMNVALPEVDGKIITRAVSFKAVQTWNSELETDVVGYEPANDRIQFVVDLAANWVRLRQTPTANRRIALILANYPTRDGRLANGVGLDTPASCVEILKALQQAGYQIENIPTSGDELIKLLTSGFTNDPEGRELRPIQQYLSLEEYQQYFTTLPEPVQAGISQRWSLEANNSHFPIPGIQLGNIFVGIQPARGYEIDPTLNYHAPDLEPTHNYLAYYYWLRENFGTQAIVHVGKHGNLEWLPGKSIALSSNCYPEVALGPLPHLYPFIVNDPGEGSQAKRRSQAVIIDHLTPPMTRAELYGPLQQLEALIDEYYEAQSLDPSRLPIIRDRILTLANKENLHRDLLFVNEQSIDNEKFAEFLSRTDGYLCELKEAQIRDGLHIFGQCPEGRQLRDLIIAIARHPETNRLGLTRALAKDLQLDFDPLTADMSALIDRGDNLSIQQITANQNHPRTIGDAIEILEQKAAELVEDLIQEYYRHINPESSNAIGVNKSISTVTNIGKAIQQELDWISNYLLPALQQTNQEIINLLGGLNGCYVPSGSSGAPTRGRPDVLPTGRNFYSVDIRAVPTETAWRIGQLAAESLIERYTQENGEYPKTLGLSIWGTSTMRTGGDDIAEALALLGVQPIWDGPSRRVIDFEILPVSILGRPRVDVTLRISGFFRDAFPNLIDLFDSAVQAVASLKEPPEQNPLAFQVQAETQFWQSNGLTQEQAEIRSNYRVFGSKPGAYGAGLQGLIESQNWTDDEDLAKAYINWSSYAYTASNTNLSQREGANTNANQGKAANTNTNQEISSNSSPNQDKPSNFPPYQEGTERGSWGESAPEAFEKRLSEMQIVLHNQDNREHDILDSDDYYQFQGGMTAAVRKLRGENPNTYFGDNSIPENPKVRQLRDEIERVYRSRAINPKWIAGVMRHGYKGAFEMAATVDYLFAYGATANCVEDFMYQGVAEAYLFDTNVQKFIQEKNPWALRDMAERLLEAHQRGLWQKVQPDILEKLRSLVHQAEGVIESASAPNR
ncbi:cobaltochelatase subunit CobN [Kamptonema animale CS-326]|jgi:cobaltochelatase CobN|uniref:cobaltochelatase subunit CobN n=1 Tax=Kamptonema animale TaxID=92934 RepID=UPI002330449D|nr:cobaltochelatase subunit CobN [Kamptonema animale]MDB9514966.1 cobaltochelatase subunit CobN [Kamptonema animale CS-326]